jgi:hypothetical protein
MEFDELVDSVQPTVAAVEAAIGALKAEGKAPTLIPELVVERLFLTPAAVLELAAAMGLGERKEPECYLPSPEEIRVETARMRASWTQTERDSHLQGAPTGRMEYAPRRDTKCPPKCD